MITNVISYFYIHRSEQNKYQEILSDFRYFKEQDAFDTKINASDVNFSFHKSIIAAIAYKIFYKFAEPVGIGWGIAEKLHWNLE